MKGWKTTAGAGITFLGSLLSLFGVPENVSVLVSTIGMGVIGIFARDQSDHRG